MPGDAPMGADVNLSSGAIGVPGTPDTDIAVECMLERFEQELDENKLRDPVLNELSKYPSAGQFFEIPGLGELSARDCGTT